ncbi:hypothetical protein SAY86_017675 [Trapa natans]|uniref:Uncharacterized protein n=1 Tax=Trapa natans TaxID=22666 RepID=A0AAN7M5I6_TRANT|nr:hypothetical protein SAY86_017675 [Trapa natans]
MSIEISQSTGCRIQISTSSCLCSSSSATQKTVVNPNPDGAMVGAPPTFASMIEALRSSLDQVLVSYYAFAGEVIVNSVSEPETLCNNSGVDFVEAAASV